MSKCRKFIIADSLKEWSQNSTTEFIECSKDDELYKIAKSKGLIIPSPDISLFKTIYAKIGESNRNGVIINRKAVEAGLPTLNFKQININHEGLVCGFILDSKLENDFIVIYGVFYKSLFQDKFEEFKKLFSEKKLYVSFEIWSSDEKGNSVIKTVKLGVREINPIVFSGAGLLFDIPQACPEAIVEKIFAQKEIKDRTLEDNIVYATKKTNEECIYCSQCSCKNEGGEKQKMAELEIEKVTVLAKKKDGDECDMGEGKKGELHVDEEGHESYMDSEAHKKMHKEMAEAEEAKKIAAQVITTETTTKIVDDMQHNKEVITVTEKVAQEVVQNDGSKSTQTTERTEVRTYTYEEVQQEVAKEITKNEELVLAALPKEVSDCVKTKTKEKAMKVSEAMKLCWDEYKSSQSKAMAEEINKKETVIAEKDKEIDKMKQELGIKDQEIAKLTSKEKEVEVKPKMEVGSVDMPEDAIEARARRIDEKITKKRNM